MATQVNMGKKEPGMVEGMLPGLISLVGTAIGNKYGGPAGGAAGGAIGGEIGKGMSSSGGQNAVDSNPRDRQMSAMQQSPTSQLQQGKAALSGMDEQDKVMLQPVLDEALKRDAMSRQRRQSVAAPQGGGY